MAIYNTDDIMLLSLLTDMNIVQLNIMNIVTSQFSNQVCFYLLIKMTVGVDSFLNDNFWCIYMSHILPDTYILYVG